jgi:hypothetical protein
MKLMPNVINIGNLKVFTIAQGSNLNIGNNVVSGTRANSSSRNAGGGNTVIGDGTSNVQGARNNANDQDVLDQTIS